ncbi:MAG: AAA domain-containing protein, partial [Thermodesulfovibrio sp.]|nr:AAA domain-containing protein [Thermodesulfovibrio sp.]
MNYQKLFNSWISYIRLEELSNIKISTNSVQNFKLYRLNSKGSIFTADRTIKLTLHSKELINYLAEKAFSKDSEEEFFLLFPIIERYTRSESYYYPLFIIPFSEKPVNFLKLDVNYGKVLDDDNSSSQVNQERSKDDNVELKWYEREFIPYELENFIVCKPVFREILKMDEDTYEKVFSGKSLLTCLRELVDLSDDVTFSEAFFALKEWCKERLNFLGQKSYKMSRFDLIFADDDLKLIEAEKIKKQLSILSNPKYDPFIYKESVAYKYLYEKQSIHFEEYNKPDNTPWWGTFHRFPLSYGQALLLQKYSKGENLISVQGPPGTGKTTILMSLIAHTLVKRALSIIENNNDYSTIILITSTANKAVENAAREFKNNPHLKSFPLYDNGGFYFDYTGGQNSKNFADSIARLERLKNYLESEASCSTSYYDEVKRRLISLYKSLLRRIETIENLKIKHQGLCEKLSKIDSEYPDLEKRISAIEGKIAEIKSSLLRNFNYSIDVLKQEIPVILGRHKLWLEEFRGSKFKSFSLDELREFINSSFEKDITVAYVYFKNYSFFDKLLDLFIKKSQKIVSNLIFSHKEFFEKMGYSISMISHVKQFVLLIDEMYSLVSQARKLLDEVEDERLVLYPDIVSYLEEYLSLNSELDHLVSVKQKRDDILSEIKNIENHYLFSYAKYDSSIFELWRTKYYLRTRAIFILSMEILLLYSILNKDKVIKCIELFIQLYSQDSYRAREEIKKIGVEEFYKYFSLVCPVHFSSLNSSPYIFDKFIYAQNENFGLQDMFLDRNFRPIYLFFVDEAGMALPHLVYPALYWSNYAIFVGDPLQLQPVVSVDKNTLDMYHDKYYSEDYVSRNRYSPALISAYHRAARCETGNPDPSNIGQACFLDYHRRCQPDIAELFTVVAGYKKLTIATSPLKGKEAEKLQNCGGKNLIFYDVEGIGIGVKNTNYGEVLAIKAICKKLKDAGYDLDCEVGVITPYVNQEILLQKELENIIPRKHIGTIHKFQGTEFPVIIMSTV